MNQLKSLLVLATLFLIMAGCSRTDASTAERGADVAASSQPQATFLAKGEIPEVKVFKSDEDEARLTETARRRIEAFKGGEDVDNFGGIEGRTELSLNVRVQGRTQSEMINSADGYAHIEFVTGVLRGVDLGGVATTIRNALRGELIAPEARTPFQGLSATFAISDGVLASDSLSMNTTDLRIPGLAVIDLQNRRLDARLAPRSPRGGVVVPFAARGPFGQLTYAHDISGRALADITPRVAQVEAASRASARAQQP